MYILIYHHAVIFHQCNLSHIYSFENVLNHILWICFRTKDYHTSTDWNCMASIFPFMSFRFIFLALYSLPVMSHMKLKPQLESFGSLPNAKAYFFTSLGSTSFGIAHLVTWREWLKGCMCCMFGVFKILDCSLCLEYILFSSEVVLFFGIRNDSKFLHLVLFTSGFCWKPTISKQDASKQRAHAKLTKHAEQGGALDVKESESCHNASGSWMMTVKHLQCISRCKMKWKVWKSLKFLCSVFFGALAGHIFANMCNSRLATFESASMKYN